MTASIDPRVPAVARELEAHQHRMAEAVKYPNGDWSLMWLSVAAEVLRVLDSETVSR